MAFKLKVVPCAEGESNRGATQRFGVDEKRMREWRKLKIELAERGPKKKRLQGGGKKTVLAADKEEQLVSWIESLRAKNLRVTRLSIQLKAREIYDPSNDSEGIRFSTSRGWLEGFFKRHGFSLRRRTTVSQRLPRDLPCPESGVVYFERLSPHTETESPAVLRG